MHFLADRKFLWVREEWLGRTLLPTVFKPQQALNRRRWQLVLKEGQQHCRHWRMWEIGSCFISMNLTRIHEQYFLPFVLWTFLLGYHLESICKTKSKNYRQKLQQFPSTLCFKNKGHFVKQYKGQSLGSRTVLGLRVQVLAARFCRGSLCEKRSGAALCQTPQLPAPERDVECKLSLRPIIKRR